MTCFLSVGPCDNFLTIFRASKKSFRDRRTYKSTPDRQFAFLIITFTKNIVELDLFIHIYYLFSGAALDRVDRVLRPPMNKITKLLLKNAEKSRSKRFQYLALNECFFRRTKTNHLSCITCNV
jgi:hypothetical protein